MSLSKSTAADPTPWKHTSGERDSTPKAPNAPIGGYIHLPCPGYSDYEDHYISTRSPEHAARMARTAALTTEARQTQGAA